MLLPDFLHALFMHDKLKKTRQLSLPCFFILFLLTELIHLEKM